MSTLPDYRACVRQQGRRISVELQSDVAADRADVFDYVAREDVLPELLTGYTPLLPGVTSTSDNTGPWSVPGSRRIVHIDGGTTAVEEVTDYSRPAYFAYKTSEYTFTLKYLATGAMGQWWFTEAQAATTVRWVYTFTASGVLGRVMLPLFSRFLWSGYMRVCLYNVHRHFCYNGKRPLGWRWTRTRLYCTTEACNADF